MNRYARVEVSGNVLRVYYVLDEAEIPAFQERRAISANQGLFLRQRVARIARSLELQVDGTTLPLRAVAQALDRPEGQGGLPTLRIAAIYTATLPAAPAGAQRRLRFADRNQPDRVGWREIVTVARGGGRIVATSAPQKDLSNELRTYPGDLIQAPLDLREATVTFVAGGTNAPADAVPASSAAPTRSGGLFTSQITRQNLNPIVLASMLAIALAVGAGHAVLPGHGKTVMAAYLVGTKGRPMDAVLLGVIVSVMHTISVLVLGFVLFRVSESTSIDRYYPQLNVVSGLLAAALGVWLLVGRLRRYRALRAVHAPEPHGHDHDDQHHADHDHDDDHDHDHDHDHDVHDHDHDHDHDVHDHDDDHDDDHDVHDHGGQRIPALVEATHGPGEPHPALDLASGGGGHRHHHGPGGHTHELPADVAPLSRRGLVLLATSGGVVPSPTAVIVVVSAFTLGRPALGLSLIAAFSVGLAVTLTAVGLTLVYGRRVIERRFSQRSFELLPTLGAVTLIVLGLVLALRGLTGRV
ncbi:MAG: hypothetical protein ACR2MB_02100 [Acidimicrobiales bacterium]